MNGKQAQLTTPWPPTSPDSDWRRDKPLHVETARMRRWRARSATLFVSALVGAASTAVLLHSWSPPSTANMPRGGGIYLYLDQVDGWLAQPPKWADLFLRPRALAREEHDEFDRSAAVTLRALDRRGSLCAHPRSEPVPDVLRACSGPIVRGPGAVPLDAEFSNSSKGKKREWEGQETNLPWRTGLCLACRIYHLRSTPTNTSGRGIITAPMSSASADPLNFQVLRTGPRRRCRTMPMSSIRCRQH